MQEFLNIEEDKSYLTPKQFKDRLHKWAQSVCPELDNEQIRTLDAKFIRETVKAKIRRDILILLATDQEFLRMMVATMGPKRDGGGPTHRYARRLILEDRYHMFPDRYWNTQLAPFVKDILLRGAPEIWEMKLELGLIPDIVCSWCKKKGKLYASHTRWQSRGARSFEFCSRRCWNRYHSSIDWIPPTLEEEGVEEQNEEEEKGVEEDKEISEFRDLLDKADKSKTFKKFLKLIEEESIPLKEPERQRSTRVFKRSSRLKKKLSS